MRAALEALGKRRLVLAIHDASFPGSPGTDPGRGTPYSEAPLAFLRFARGLGFDALMLGPQGITARDNPSPYDGTLFSRNVLDVDLAADPPRLVEAQLGDAFASAAGHVLVFFPDLLGMEEVYNRAGEVHPENWSLRVPPDYAERCRDGRAPNLRRVLAMALHARGEQHAAPLAARFESRLSGAG